MSSGRIYKLEDFYFHLPEKLIAQYPTQNRELSRLFIIDRNSIDYKHRRFFELGHFLRDGDVLVRNNTRVIPARMFFNRKSGGLVEFVLTQKLSSSKWLAISNRTKKLKENEILYSNINPSVEIKIIGRVQNFLKIETNIDLNENILKKIGIIPLPPYIKRGVTDLDQERYQTVYSKSGVAAAAPTAGLHFTDELITDLKKKGVEFVDLNLDISWGTFQPVRDNDISKHMMHVERFNFPAQSANFINKARRERRRIIAVGTTALRVLESTFIEGENVPEDGETDIFIYPPYKIKSIDAMITNFHTPYSTLLMLVSSFAGYDKIMDGYNIAVQQEYRFFSYGDAMLIL